MKTGINPCVDYAFKRVFGSSEYSIILPSFVQAVRGTTEDALTELLLLNPFSVKDSATDKLAILDIKARDAKGRHLNIEMQLFGFEVLPNRILYYWAKLHTSQLKEGDSYAKLMPTISIAIVNAVLYPDVKEFIQHFQLRSDPQSDELFSEQISIYLIELPKFQLQAHELKTPLDQWIYFLKHGAELDKNALPEKLQTPPIQQAMEVLDMLSQSDIEREQYEARLKWQRDQMALQEEAESKIERSYTRGQAEGRVEGRAHGKAIAAIQLYQRLLGLPIAPDETLADLPLVELQLQATALEEEFRNRRG